MGKLLLVGRLALRDLRRRRAETALLLLAILMATTTLTLGLVLRDSAKDPYQSTRTATHGPDVVASVRQSADVVRLEGLAGNDGVTGRSGPYPVIAAKLRASGRTSDVQVVGRDTAAASVDQPKVTEGSWVSAGSVVLEASFAATLRARVGDQVTLEGRSFRVTGIAVTAAMPPYPGDSCIVIVGCASGVTDKELAGLPSGLLVNPGLVWLTQADVRSLAQDPSSVAYLMNLKLADPGAAQAFIDARLSAAEAQPAAGPPPWRLQSWQEVREDATQQARDTQILLLIGAWLLGLLAIMSLSVLVGGRMAEQTRRVGLLKAAGGTPGLIAAVLLAEYALVALAAAAAGLLAGWLAAPLLAGAGPGLVGSPGLPPMTLSKAGVVIAVALGVAALATVVPAVRAARASTVDALADSARPPRRVGWLIAVSARLPVPLLLALRVAARRPRRIVLSVVSIATTVGGIFVALILNAILATQPLATGHDQAQADQLRRVLLVVMVGLAALAAVNAVFLTWATVLDNRHSSALARALGASPREMSTALAAAQVLPALAGAGLGVPTGFALFALIMGATGGDGSRATYPPVWQLVVLVLATGLVVAALTVAPARLGGRRPVAETLQAGLA